MRLHAAGCTPAAAGGRRSQICIALNPIPRPAACDEGAPTAKLGDNERTDRLLAAEAAVLAAGGCVVRLVGLYHANR